MLNTFKYANTEDTTIILSRCFLRSIKCARAPKAKSMLPEKCIETDKNIATNDVRYFLLNKKCNAIKARGKEIPCRRIFAPKLYVVNRLAKSTTQKNNEISLRQMKNAKIQRLTKVTDIANKVSLTSKNIIEKKCNSNRNPYSNLVCKEAISSPPINCVIK